jgi:hypothetical protein
MTLLPPEERKGQGLGATEISQNLRQRLADIQEAATRGVSPPPARPGDGWGFKPRSRPPGSGSGLQSATDALVTAGNQQPSLVASLLLLTPIPCSSTPMWIAPRLMMLDAAEQPVRYLQVYLGSSYVKLQPVRPHLWVMAQAEGPFRLEAIAKLKTRMPQESWSHSVPRRSAERSAPTACCAITCSRRGDQWNTAPGVGSGRPSLRSDWRPGRCPWYGIE